MNRMKVEAVKKNLSKHITYRILCYITSEFMVAL